MIGSVEERFAAKFEQSESGCWDWRASTDAGGYGQMRVGPRGSSRLRPAHRLAYELLVGPIPEGLDLDHLCRNRRCVNPAHLEPVTRSENLRRGARSALATHCPRGHAFDDENTLRTSRGHRYCRTCNREACKARHRRARGA